MQQFIHYFLHFIFPVFIAWFFYRKTWLKAYLIMLATMLVDADHLLARPIYDPCRCSIGFHPLHSPVAIAVYCLLLFFPRTRLIAIGLLLHMATDGIDCLFILKHCL
ncbi:hypothetical protein F0L74_08760 [Chitinophaga agrisoli]|uniref:LexA-binding, inner membrane-associated hydrolase n=1 Tax=Chitinophaga agrisoli TaxID=2607653 RepID=A0A5B2VU92_9BACT|nr:DUF6122 family protein [Chitinophaga agrisoli]KAA2242615.1 hypothetical protein F0L74_08760 [Chitinophaga agrisoli]